jgi:hypothetical protein
MASQIDFGTVVRIKGINDYDAAFDPPAWGVVVDDHRGNDRACAHRLTYKELIA